MTYEKKQPASMQLEKFWDQKPEYHLEWPYLLCSFGLILWERLRIAAVLDEITSY